MNKETEKTEEGGTEASATNQAMPGGVIRVDESMIKNHLDKVVVSTVEQTLNALLDAEAEQLCKAGRYEHTDKRVTARAGHYERQYHTKAGEVTLRMPKLRKLPFETAIIERYRRRESSVEEALVEMYLAGVSVRRVEDITEALWGSRVSPSTLSELNQKIAVQIDAWRARPVEGEHVYVYLDGIWLKRSWGGEVKNVSILVAVGVNAEGCQHWRSLRTNNPLERLMREIRRRTRAVGAFPDGNSAMLLVAARLRHVAGSQWGQKRYMDMSHLKAANIMENPTQAA